MRKITPDIPWMKNGLTLFAGIEESIERKMV